MARKGRVRVAAGGDNEENIMDGKEIASAIPQQSPIDDDFPELPRRVVKWEPKSNIVVQMKCGDVGLSERKKPTPLTLPVEMGGGDAFISQYDIIRTEGMPTAGNDSGDEMPMGQLYATESMFDLSKPVVSSGVGRGILASPMRGASLESIETTLDDNGHRYVGLRNQAMTCYLNSLIQTLYMTPEFRNAIYNWQFSGKQEDEGRSIACQLQKLFLLLQTSNKESLETKDLTASFGWSGCEVYDQHDVQELCRVMFDALEHKWRNTSNSSLIQDLYRGTMVDFVKCLNCQRESVKPDTFLDLPLAMNRGGTGDAYKSVEEALHAFVKPEILEGADQYSCDNCGTNQDALKGLRFTQFPYLLTIQLKRFDFDRNTFHRIKLNDKMTFPMLLNLNEFMHGPSKNAEMELPKKMSWADAVASNRKPISPPTSSQVNYVERAEQQSIHIKQEEVEALIEKDGPCLYELFSVMVHQGSAAGGHYFAFIKNMDQDAWFCFNDCSVTVATIDDIHKTFGGSSGGWSSSNTNAYMLMYRKIDRQRNASFVKTVNLPPHLNVLLRRWEREEEEKLERKRREETLVNVNVLFNSGKFTTLLEAQRTLRIPYTAKLRDVYVEAMLSFAHPDQLQCEDDVRLLKCGNFMFSILRAFTAKEMEEMTLADTFPCCANRIGYRSDVYIMLDLKPRTMSSFYEIAEMNFFTVSVVPVNVENSEFLGSRLVQFSDRETIRMMKTKLAALYEESSDEVDNLRLVMDKGTAASPTMVLLNNNELRATFVLANATVAAITLYTDVGSPGPSRDEDRRVDFVKSRMFKILERKKHSISLKIRLPNSADYKHAGMSAPGSITTSRSATPIAPTNEAIAATNLTDASVAISDLQCVPQIHTLQPAQVASSHLSPAYSNISDDEKDTMEFYQSGALSDVCTPVLSPSVSEVEDLSDMEEANSRERCERYERTFNAVVAASSGHVSEMGGDNIEWFEPFEQREQQPQTPRSSVGTITGGTHTPSYAEPHEIVTLNKVVGEQFNELMVSVDGRQLVTELKEWVSEIIGVPPTQFVILKHYKEDDEGYDSNATNENETLRDAYSTVSYISVKLRAPLKENERLIRIIRFDIDTAEHEKWPFLFEVAGTVEMSVRVLLQKCHDMLDTVYALSYDLNRLRLRDMVTGLGMPMLNMADRLGRRGNEWHKAVYLQILTEEQAEEWRHAGIGAYPVMVRRWQPSKLEVGPLVELTLSPMHKNQVAALKQGISTHYHVPIDQIELTVGLPANAWSKWPYTKERIELIETVDFTSAGKVPPTGTFNGKLVYFRLSGEPVRLLSIEEKRAIILKDSSINTAEVLSRRPERPLRIQLSTSISDDISMDP